MTIVVRRERRCRDQEKGAGNSPLSLSFNGLELSKRPHRRLACAHVLSWRRGGLMLAEGWSWLFCYLLFASLAVPLPPAAAAEAAGDSLLWSGPYTRAETDDRPNYRAGLSGTLGQMMQGTVDFAVSDIPMTDAQLEETPARILHFSTNLDAEVVIYNLPGMPPDKTIRLTGPVLADIYLAEDHGLG